MGLFDSIRRVIGGGDDGSGRTGTRPDLVDVSALDPEAFRRRAENAAGDAAPLDFSVASLERLDDAIAARDDWTEETPTDGTAYSPKAVQFGSYLGEVLVRSYDGEWTEADGWSVTVAGRDEAVAVDVFDVAARSVAGDPVFAAAAERVATELGAVASADHETDDPSDDEVADAASSVSSETDASEVEDDTPVEAGTSEAEDDATVETDAESTATSRDDGDLIAPDATAPDDASDDGADGDATAAEADGDERAETDAVAVADAVYPTFDTHDGTDTSATAGDDSSPVPDSDDDDSNADAADATPAEDDGDLSDDSADATPADEAVSTRDATAATASGPFEADGSEPTADRTAEESEAASDAATDTETDPAGDSEPTQPDRVSVPDAEAMARSADDADDARATDDSPPAAGDGLRAEYAAAAAEFTDFWAECDLDFTPASLSRLDDLVAAEWDDDRFVDATFGSEATFDDRAFTSVTTELGSYFGEVLVRELGGEWSDDTDHEAVVVVEGTDGPLAVPVFRVAANSLRATPAFDRSYEALLDDLGRGES